jgi:phosphoenolpyruvate carboxykinase (ATP)
MSIDHTRAMVRAALSGKLEGVETRMDRFFRLRVPVSCPGVPSEVLDPRSTWANGKVYDDAARKLAGMFAENFRLYANSVPPEVRDAGVHG